MNWTNYLNGNRIESSKRNTSTDPRNDFESDSGRVIFSPATRRMHDKTQVFPLTTDDNIHSRLTHSLEVMEIGHSLGLRLCANHSFLKSAKLEPLDAFRQIPTILKNACLVHDIGNPPFGHFGETVISNYFQEFFKLEHWKNKFNLTPLEIEDFTFFDGNAQGFRVLTKLQVLNRPAGLNLTYGTLGAFLKYPNAGIIDKDFIAKSKRGVFQSEKEYLKLVGENCKLIKNNTYTRHPLSYLMEAADSICYLTMDIEDGFNKGWYKFDLIESSFSKFDQLSSLFKNLNEISSHGSEISKMVGFRIGVISILVDLALEKFMTNLESICEGTYNCELIKDDPNDLAKALQTFCVNNIFKKREIQQLELTGHSVITGLLNYYIDFIFIKSKDYRKRAKGMISSSIIRSVTLETGIEEYDQFSDYYKLRVIVDFISGMTDQFALNQYQKLSGQKI